MKVPEKAKKKIIKQKVNNERGSVTLFVLIAMLFLLTIGLIIFMSNMNNNASQERDIKKIRSEYNGVDTGELDKIYEEQQAKQSGRLVISVLDSYKKIYQSSIQDIDTIWINEASSDRLPLSVDVSWPEGVKESQKKVEIEGIRNTVVGEAQKTHVIIKENQMVIDESQVDLFDAGTKFANLIKDCDITITATANEGTSSQVSKSITIRIDRTKPEISSENDGGTIWGDVENSDEVTIDTGKINSTDATSDVKSIEYIYSSEKTTPQENDSRWEALGSDEIKKTVKRNEVNEQEYYVHYKVTDNAGNVEIKSSEAYQVKFANYRIEKEGQSNKYAMTLADAVSKTTGTGYTIKQLQDCTDATAVKIGDNKSIVFNNNGKTLTKTTSAITINAGATLEVAGSGTITTAEALVMFRNYGTFDITHTGMISSNNTSNTGFIINHGGTLNKTGTGTITSARNAQTILNDEEGNVSISSGTVSNTGSASAIHTRHWCNTKYKWYCIYKNFKQ